MKINKIFSEVFQKIKKYSYLYKYLILIAVITIVFLYLKPVLKSGWILDDQSLYGQTATKFSLKDKLTSFFVTGGLIPGRFFPLAGFTLMFFYFVGGNVVLGKQLVLLSIFICIYLFYNLVKRLSGNQYLALLACAIIPAFFQFRFFYDPIIAFSAFMPWIFILTISSLLLLDLFLETGKWRYYILSLIPYTMSLYTYEITYAFLLLHLSVIYFRRNNIKDIFRYGSGFIVSLSIAAMASIYTRIQYQALIGVKTVATYSVNFVPKIYFLTVLKQLYAALPFSYSLSNPSQVLTQDLGYRLVNIHPLDIVIVGLFLVCYFTLIKKIKISPVVRKRFLIFGLLLFTLPSLMIALARTYQNLLVFGIGYLPVYIQYFGACILLIGIASFIYANVRSYKIRKHLKISLAIILSIIFLVNLQNNRLILEKMNQAYWYPRNILEVSAKNKMFKDVPTNATLIMESDDNLSLDYPPFIYFLTKRDIFTLNSKKIPIWHKDNIKPKSLSLPGEAEKYFIDKGPVYFFRYWSISSRNGYVIITEVSDFQIDPEAKKTPIKMKDMKIYFLGDSNLKLNISFTKLLLDPEKKILTKSSIVTITKGFFKVIQRSKNGDIFQVPIKLDPDDWIDFQSVRLNPTSELPYLTDR